MGLTIDNYSYSYGMLHRLRQWALDTEGKREKLMCTDFGKLENCGKCVYCKLAKGDKPTKYIEFINHSDCDGGYRRTQKRRNVMWGNLTNLKKEIRELNKNGRTSLDFRHKQAWCDFYKDVISEKDVVHFG